MKSTENMCWEYGVPTDADIQCAIAGFVEAVVLVAVGSVDRHAMAALRESSHLDEFRSAVLSGDLLRIRPAADEHVGRFPRLRLDDRSKVGSCAAEGKAD